MEQEIKMRRFVLVRNEDETGISGTGVVAEGIVFWDGTCVIKWITDTSSINIYKSYVEMIHLHGHAGRTVIQWIDERKEEKKEKKEESVHHEIDDHHDVEELKKVTETLVKVSEKLTKKAEHKQDDE